MPITRSDVLTEARTFHEAIRRADDEALRELARSWRVVRADLLKQERDFLARLVKKYGTPLRLTPNELYRVERLDALIAQVDAQVSGWAKDAHGMVADSRALAFRLALEHADAYFALTGFAGMQMVTHVSDPAFLEAAVSRARTSAVRGLFDSFGAETGQRVRNLIVGGVGSGRHPLAVAADLVRATDVPAWRAANISRTEMMHAYRGGSINAWQSSPVIEGWAWMTAGDRRVCPVCRAMEGSVHKLDEPFASHPSCRCVPVPQTLSWTDLGFDGVSESVEPLDDGDTVFARLSAADQRAVLGPGRYELYQQGTPLSAMVRDTYDPMWGPGRALIPLSEMG